MKKVVLSLMLLVLFSSTYCYYLNLKTERATLSESPKPVTQTEVEKPFTILLVPGHDTDSGGAKFKDVYERDLVALIAEKISAIFEPDPAYKIIVSRNKENWNPILLDYFKSQEAEIINFKNIKQAEDKILMSAGQKKFVPDMALHSNVDKETAIKLYGINKWSGENGVDLVLHFHFNDSERPNMDYPGEYKGFTIFLPEKQMINSSSSRLVAENIYAQLKEILVPEVIGKQKDSLIEDQSLIALGASGTLTQPALLIEYGYIYQKEFRTTEDRENIVRQIAEKTAQGIKNYANIIGK